MEDENSSSGGAKKKRRLLEGGGLLAPHHDDTMSSSCCSSSHEQMIKALQDENKRLRENQASLKDIACRALRRNIEWDLRDNENEWMHDSELLAAAVYGGYEVWNTLPPSLKSDFNIAIAAIRGADAARKEKRTSSLLRFPRWEDLPETLRFNPDVILAALKCQHGPVATIWTKIPAEIKQTHGEIALFGVMNFDTEDPDKYRCLLDTAFMKERLLLRELSWRRLPTQLKTDIEFARSLDIIPSEYLAQAMFSDLPVLSANRTVWEAILRGTAAQRGWGDLAAIIRAFAPHVIRADREIMLQACGFDGKIVQLVDASLSINHDFLVAAVDRNYHILAYLTHETQRRFPDIVDIALGRLREGYRSWQEFHVLGQSLAPDFWDDWDFVLRWFEHGCPFMGILAVQRPGWREDQEIFMRLAKYCIDECVDLSFWQASTSLRSDKKFMLQVVGLRPSLFKTAFGRLRNDFDLALIFFSGEESLVQEEVCRSRRERNTHAVDAFRFELSARLNAHRIFCTTVLPAMSLARSNDPHCTLAVLNQGADTSLGYKQLIAEFLGVPVGKQLGLLRQASRNISTVFDTHEDMNV